jgi:hypothetical protein
MKSTGERDNVRMRVIDFIGVAPKFETWDVKGMSLLQAKKIVNVATLP